MKSSQLSSVQSLSHVWPFVTPWTALRQASLSVTNSCSLLKLMSIKSMMPSNHLFLCCPLLLLPSILSSIRVLTMSQLFTSGGQSTGASASVHPMNVQGWSPLGLTGLISLLSKGLSRVFFSTSIVTPYSVSFLISFWSTRLLTAMGLCLSWTSAPWLVFPEGQPPPAHLLHQNLPSPRVSFLAYIFPPTPGGKKPHLLQG